MRAGKNLLLLTYYRAEQEPVMELAYALGTTDTAVLSGEELHHINTRWL